MIALLDRTCKARGLQWLLRTDEERGYFIHVYSGSAPDVQTTFREWGDNKVSLMTEALAKLKTH